ncbi:MAG: LysR substrate-binding domain-containing protein [Paracoccaceae bacterium]|nr:LysR substrate-binding domain-containing protein [Paracoccaceae bacterium]
MSYSQLRAFHYVALKGGFSRAAEAMNISQPGVSEQVRKLEQDYDVLLFNRGRRAISLTAVGQKLFLLTKRFFEIEQEIEEYISETRVEMDGRIRIIADSAHHVTQILTEFRKRYPKVHVLLQSGNSEDVVDKLRSYDAEIGVMGSLTPGGDIETLDLGATEIIAFAAQGVVSAGIKQMNLENLAQYPLVFREVGSKTREKIEREALRQGVVLTPIIEAEGREAMREVVASGAGIGFVSKAEFGDDQRLVQIAIDGVDLHMSETIAFLGQRGDLRIIRAFIHVAQECLDK